MKAQNSQQHRPPIRLPFHRAAADPAVPETESEASTAAASIIVVEDAAKERNHAQSSDDASFHKEWTVILKNDPAGQMVLYDQQHQQLVLRQTAPSVPASTTANLPSNDVPKNASVNPAMDVCPLCGGGVGVGGLAAGDPSSSSGEQHAAVPPGGTTSYTNAPRFFMDSNYFRLLDHATKTSRQSANFMLGSTGTSGFAAAGAASPSSSRSSTASDQHLPETAFNDGYYTRFFRETQRLGRGYRGAVFLCQHVLDNVALGDYAVKKIPVGDDKKWLARMLGEVRTLENLRHYNVIEYKHCWLEDHQLTKFGPPVPCLFILMELANGGSLEEYVLARMQQAHQDDTSSPSRTSAFRRKRLNSESSTTTSTTAQLLSVAEIMKFFLDICDGLAHLHQHGILHRDLLLKYANPQNAKEIPRILISDFGECERLFSMSDLHRRSGCTGTLEFTAPEMLRVDQKGNYFVEYSPAADMWSLGMVLVYMCYGRLPYAHVEDVDKLGGEIRSFKDLTAHTELREIRIDLPMELLQLMRILLSVNPRERPSARSILHTFASAKLRGGNTMAGATVQKEDLRDLRQSETEMRPDHFPRSLPSPDVVAMSAEASTSMELNTSMDAVEPRALQVGWRILVAGVKLWALMDVCTWDLQLKLMPFGLLLILSACVDMLRSTSWRQSIFWMCIHVLLQWFAMQRVELCWRTAPHSMLLQALNFYNIIGIVPFWSSIAVGAILGFTLLRFQMRRQ